MTATQRDQPSARLSIVILNYRTPELTIACLRSLAPELAALPPTEVVVTDNASADGSAAKIESAISAESMGAWARVEPLPKNGGYAYGNNAAIRTALARRDPPDYVLLLNPDTQVRSGAVRALLEFMQEHPECAIAGSLLEDERGAPHSSAFNFPSAWSELDRGLALGVLSRWLAERSIHRPIPDGPCAVDWVAGASMLVRRQVFERVGLIDEAYFLYFEEVDFLLRAKRAGFQTFYVPASRVVHHMGASTGVTDESGPPRRIPTYWFDSRRRYFLKNHGLAHAALADSAFVLGHSLRRLRRRLWPPKHGTKHGDKLDPPHMLRDYLRNSVFARGASLLPARID